MDMRCRVSWTPYRPPSSTTLLLRPVNRDRVVATWHCCLVVLLLLPVGLLKFRTVSDPFFVVPITITRYAADRPTDRLVSDGAGGS